jgi:hypothetical protein
MGREVVLNRTGLAGRRDEHKRDWPGPGDVLHFTQLSAEVFARKTVARTQEQDEDPALAQRRLQD